MEIKETPENVKDRVKASYDAMAVQYNTWTQSHSPLRLKYMDKLFKLQPSLLDSAGKPRVLELGCGAGLPVLLTLLEKNDGMSVVGNDISTSQIELARKNLAGYEDRVELQEGDMTKLEYAPGSISAAIALYSIVHLPLDEQRLMMRNLYGWLEDGGHLLVNFGKSTSEGSVQERWLDAEKGWMYWSGLGPERTARMLEDSGFVIGEQTLEEGEDESFVWFLARKETAKSQRENV